MIDPLVAEFQKDARELQTVGDRLHAEAAALSTAVLDQKGVPIDLFKLALRVRDESIRWAGLSESLSDGKDLTDAD